jgi:tetratricopeptide (TPR) repeat protein
MGSSTEDLKRRARACFDAAEFSASRQAALEGLSVDSEDVELLLLAGRAGVELDADDAVAQLRRATELAAHDAVAWHFLGEALAAEGRTEEAGAAFRRAVELDPSDEVALTHLGHTSLAAGRQDEGMGYLARAADTTHSASTATISLVDMYRSFGEYEKALEQARRLVGAAPDDIVTWLDIAELSLQVGRLDDASDAFARLRDLDDVPGHEAYPLHGMIQVEIRRSQWDRAAALAAQAATIDEHGLTTDLAAFLAAQSSDPVEPDAPTAAEVDAALSASLAIYRRAVSEDRHMGRAGLGG